METAGARGSGGGVINTETAIGYGNLPKQTKLEAEAQTGDMFQAQVEGSRRGCGGKLSRDAAGGYAAACTVGVPALGVCVPALGCPPWEEQQREDVAGAGDTGGRGHWGRWRSAPGRGPLILDGGRHGVGTIPAGCDPQAGLLSAPRPLAGFGYPQQDSYRRE